MKVEEVVRKGLSTHGSVIHISMHSFTPVMEGVTRDCDIGLLYNPLRLEEKEFCNGLFSLLSSVRVRRNYPYHGSSDGLTTELRKVFEKNYIGVEIELNQKFTYHPDKEENAIFKLLVEAIYAKVVTDSHSPTAN